MGESDHLIEERKEKFVAFCKRNTHLIYYAFLAVIVFIAVRIRTLNLPGLRDVTTGGWTLGPDLDPFLFLRYAKEIVLHGSLPLIDHLRYVPLGFEAKSELLLLPYLVAWFHKLAGMFGSTSIEQSAVIYPAVAFGLTVIAFFFLVRKMFLPSLGITKASLVALLSSFFLSVIPVFMPRSIAGIPEKESTAFLFMFLAFLWFLCSWDAQTRTARYSYAALAGIATALMALVWGGYIYVFIILALSMFVMFLAGASTTDRFVTYTTWLVASLICMIPFSTRYSLSNLIVSNATGLGIGIFGLLIFHLLLTKTTLKRYVEKTPLATLPTPFSSLILFALFGGILLVISGNTHFITQNVNDIVTNLVRPITSRLGVTVAENRQPFFTEWSSSFGPIQAGIPLFFWLFVIGSIYLCYALLEKLAFKERIIATGGYALFLLGLIFSRYAGGSRFDGTNVPSLALYVFAFCALGYGFAFSGMKSSTYARYYTYLSSILLGVLILLMLITPEAGTALTASPISKLLLGVLITVFSLLTLLGISKEESYKELDFNKVLVLSFFFFCVISTRGAVRLILMLVPPTSIIVSYFLVAIIAQVRTSKEDTTKIMAWIAVGLMLLTAVISAYAFTQGAIYTAQSYVPASYHQQWQKAMAWVRENTSMQAVFGHWWDYGYWVQTLGERATVLDGGNYIPYWNHLMGRYALTGTDNQAALAFLYAHNTTHFLIDSSDIGKYSAFSSIGSDEHYDRASWISTFVRNEQQTQETKNTTVSLYQGGTPLDGDIFYETNGTTLFLPAGKAGLGGILLERNASGALSSQPIGIFVYTNKQYRLPLRYAYQNKFIDFGSGIEAGVFLMPSFGMESNTIVIKPGAALLYLSNRTVKSQVARLYLYKEQNPYFELMHSEDDDLVRQLRTIANFTEDFIYYEGVHGPIRIWEIHYPSFIASNASFLNTQYPEALRTA